jgi:hypothetical protein
VLEQELEDKKGDRDDKTRLYLAENHRLLADWQDLLGDPAKAEENYRLALKAYPLSDRLDVAGREFRPRLERIETLLGLCKVLQSPPKPEDWNALEWAVSELQGPPAGDPRNDLLGRVHTVRANLLTRVPGQQRKAEADYRAALRVLAPFGKVQGLAAKGQERGILALAQTELSYGAFLARSGRKGDLESAVAHLQSARQPLTRLIASNQETTVPARDLARVTANQAAVKGLLARVADQERSPAEAERLRVGARQLHTEAVREARDLSVKHKELPDYDCLLVTALVGQAQHEIGWGQVNANADLATAKTSLAEADELAGKLYRAYPSSRAALEARVRVWHALGGLLLLEYRNLPGKQRRDRSEKREKAQEYLEQARKVLMGSPRHFAGDTGFQQELDELRGNLLLCYRLGIDEIVPAEGRRQGVNDQQINEQMESLVGKATALYRARIQVQRPTQVAELVALGVRPQATTAWSQVLLIDRCKLAQEEAEAFLAHAELLAGLAKYREAAERVDEIFAWGPPDWSGPKSVVVLARGLNWAVRADGIPLREEYVASRCRRVLQMIPRRLGPDWFQPEIRNMLRWEVEALKKLEAPERSRNVRDNLRQVANELRGL